MPAFCPCGESKREHRRLVGALSLSVGKLAVSPSAEFGKAVYAHVELRGDLHEGSPSYIALDEACHLVGRKIKGLDVDQGPPRGHAGEFRADRSMLGIHRQTPRLAERLRGEPLQIGSAFYSFPCPNRAHAYFMVASFRISSPPNRYLRR